MEMWDVAVVGGGPAGMSAAHAAARAGARTVVLEKATHPRYKTCGGGLLGTSLAAVSGLIDVPADDWVGRATFTLDGRRQIERTSDRPVLAMVRREAFDHALRKAAAEAGAEVRERVTVRGLEDAGGHVVVRPSSGTPLAARAVIGADGSSGITSRHVGVAYAQVDLGLEVELPIPPALRERWRGRLLIDWGPIPGSYAWVFPKGDRLTVGVIAERGQGAATKAYLRGFVERLGLSGIEPVHDSGHLTRCRTPDSPLRRGRVLVAGDAGGLLEPWTREGISFALRSGTYAGEAAAAGDLGRYESTVEAQLGTEMWAGRKLLAAYSRRPGAFHTLLATPTGWSLFARFCRGEPVLLNAVRRRSVRAALRALS
ncbi:geranylgeranyl reductase family protein [Phytohabitans houttuyneae]|uniref:geranylgeranyl reductase family protein n=1 Tax=Phytohabitans houttuyneae TaxID=1076126 RepID=UPI001567683F|nr:geranylgeranyl reductase family protein [Phytohabitans houttuyneae]